LFLGIGGALVGGWLLSRLLKKLFALETRPELFAGE
jgi:uncharacterized membrane protein YeaQ/YmgE (transglycosylase-associated protein family)